MNDEVIDMKDFKHSKFKEHQLKDYVGMSETLQSVYKLLRPYFRYKPIFKMGRDIVEIRAQVLDKIKDIKEELK